MRLLNSVLLLHNLRVTELFSPAYFLLIFICQNNKKAKNTYTYSFDKRASEHQKKVESIARVHPNIWIIHTRPSAIWQYDNISIARIRCSTTFNIKDEKCISFIFKWYNILGWIHLLSSKWVHKWLMKKNEIALEMVSQWLKCPNYCLF